MAPFLAIPAWSDKVKTAFLNDVHEIPQELFWVTACCENKRENQKENDHDGGGGGPEK